MRRQPGLRTTGVPSSAEGQSLGQIAASFGISAEEALAIWQTRDMSDLADDVLRTPSPRLKGRKK